MNATLYADWKLNQFLNLYEFISTDSGAVFPIILGEWWLVF